jgi:hypothetical protein
MDSCQAVDTDSRAQDSYQAAQPSTMSICSAWTRQRAAEENAGEGKASHRGLGKVGYKESVVSALAPFHKGQGLPTRRNACVVTEGTQS